MRTLVLIVAIVAGASAAAAAAPQPDDAPLTEGAAAAGAVAGGAALIAEGEALGKAGKYEVALARFRAAAAAFPSATHDCYVALTYFRLGGLTAARLYLDSAGRRGDEVPGWCSGRLEDQLTAELARRGYVAVDIAVTPADAVVSAGEVRVVGGRRTWLPPGPIAVTAERAGYERATEDAAIPASAPASGVAITLPGCAARWCAWPGTGRGWPTRRSSAAWRWLRAAPHSTRRRSSSAIRPTGSTPTIRGSRRSIPGSSAIARSRSAATSPAPR